jgi:ParB family transcriptional regulator, chromosome partitioning protein
MTDTTTTPNEAEAVTEQALGELEHLDPNDLQVGDNIREYANLNKPFLDSIAEHGVLVPLTAIRRPDGVVEVRNGQRRTMAARKAGLSTVPVYVLAATAADTAAETIDRIVHQIVTNDQKQDLSNAQRARGIQQMIDAGLTAQKVAKKLSVAKDTVKAAEAAAKSRVALEALESQQITLTEAAVLTEFEQDGSEAIDRLVSAAGTPQFDHVVAQLRSERASAQARAEAVAHYTERGFTMIDDDDRWGWKPDRVPLRHLQRDGDDGEPVEVDDTVITDPQHWAVRLEEFVQYVDADGNVVDEQDIDWDTEGDPDAEPTEGLRHADHVVERAAFEPEWFCLNPEGAGLQASQMYQRNSDRIARDRSGQSHTATTDLDDDASEDDRQAARLRAEAEQAEAQKRERRIVVNLNKLGAAATGVRREFIKTLLARPSQGGRDIRGRLPGPRQLHADPAQPRRGHRRTARHRRGRCPQGRQRPARGQRQPRLGDRAGAGIGLTGSPNREGRVAQPRSASSTRRGPNLLRTPGDQRRPAALLTGQRLHPLRCGGSGQRHQNRRRGLRRISGRVREGMNQRWGQDFGSAPTRRRPQHHPPARRWCPVLSGSACSATSLVGHS